MKIIFIYITNPTEKEAGKIARRLLQKRLIACANIFPIKSVYRWKGKIAQDKEFALIAKTLAKNYGKIKKEVEKIHPYEIPCIVKIAAAANPEYAAWLKKETQKSA